MFSSGFRCKVITGSLMRLFNQNFEVWSIYFLTNVFIAVKGTHFCIFIQLYSNQIHIFYVASWIGRWCWVASRALLLLWYIVGQGPAVLVASARRVDCILISSIVSSFSNDPSLWRRLDMTETLWTQPL